MSKQIIKHQFCLIGFIIIFLGTSCQRSRFAITTRHYYKGRVTYANNFRFESRKSINYKPLSNYLKREEKQTTTSDYKTDPTPLSLKINPIQQQDEDKLTASISTEPVIIDFYKNKVISSEKSMVSGCNSVRLLTSSSCPDTIIKKKLDENGINKIPAAGQRKVEKHALAGFILSILGLFPILGLPLAIIGISFGASGLHRIKKDTAHYKGKGFSITSIILGVLGTIVSLLLIGMFIALIIWGQSGG